MKWRRRRVKLSLMLNHGRLRADCRGFGRSGKEKAFWNGERGRPESSPTCWSTFTDSGHWAPCNFCKPNPVQFSERSASEFGLGRVKVPTNMCWPKVDFRFHFRFARLWGRATGKVCENFGGNLVTLDSQRGRVQQVGEEPLGFTLQGSAERDKEATRQKQNCFTRGSLENGWWMGRGRRRSTCRRKNTLAKRRPSTPHVSPLPSAFYEQSTLSRPPRKSSMISQKWPGVRSWRTMIL